MILTDMKMPKKSEKEIKDTCMPMPEKQDRWPYGLQIRFEKEQIAKLPEAAKLKVGDIVAISGMGMVTSVRISERQEGGKDHSVEIQIEQIGLEHKKKPDKMSNSEFRKWREEGGGR